MIFLDIPMACVMCLWILVQLTLYDTSVWNLWVSYGAHISCDADSLSKYDELVRVMSFLVQCCDGLECFVGLKTGR